MSDERREPTGDDVRRNNAAAPQRSDSRQAAAREQRAGRGPFTTAVAWLGHAFDRTQINKREADERRRRFM